MIYYLLNISENYLYKFIDLNELLFFVSKYNSYDNKKNYILESLSMNKNDLIRDFSFDKLVKRSYMVYDEYYRIVDLRFFKDTLLNFRNNDKKRVSKHYIFRKSSIPKTGKKYCKKYKIESKKNCLLTELKYSLDIEFKSFFRNKRLNKIKESFYNEYEFLLLRKYKKNKSWKQNKKRKQWM